MFPATGTDLRLQTLNFFSFFYSDNFSFGEAKTRCGSAATKAAVRDITASRRATGVNGRFCSCKFAACFAVAKRTIGVKVLSTPWKWGASARYYASKTKTMLPPRKSVPRSRRQSDHTKTILPSKRDANCSGMDMSTVHQVWTKLSCKAQWKGAGRQGRQKKRWEDNTMEWTGLEFGKWQRAAENREK